MVHLIILITVQLGHQTMASEQDRTVVLLEPIQAAREGQGRTVMDSTVLELATSSSRHLLMDFLIQYSERPVIQLELQLKALMDTVMVTQLPSRKWLFIATPLVVKATKNTHTPSNYYYFLPWPVLDQFLCKMVTNKL